eukprot:XP_011668973.1 PREDICTED: digestive organ expansion factor homolog [Strongylocentrotus purpuratus]
MTPYQELLANLGADGGGDNDLSDEEDLDDSEEEDGEQVAGDSNDDEDSDIDEEEDDVDDEDSEEGNSEIETELLSNGEEEEDSNEEEEDEEEEEEKDEEGSEEEKEEEEEDLGSESESNGDDDEHEESQSQVNKDPFLKRVNHELSEDFISVLSKGRPSHKFEDKWSCLGKLSCSCYDNVSQGDLKVCRETDFKSLHVPKRVSSSWREANKDYIDAGSEANLSRLQQELFSIMNSSKDLVYPERSYKNEEEIRLVYCLHVLSYIVKSRNIVQKHNQMLTANPELDTESMRDQGLTRPRVLILVPFRSSALEVIKTMAKILIPSDQTMSHRKRFFEEYGGGDDPESNIVKPEDWEAMFRGNNDDHFRLGVTITRKSFKLYSTFYSADIIIASPLGLRTVIGAKGEDKHEYDFLSSIELLVMDQADVFLMQNWEHITHIMEHLHLQPKDSHDVDFSRVRMWALNKWNKYYRQTLIFSSVNTPEINALASKHCSNILFNSYLHQFYFV